MKPTSETYVELDRAYDFFNKKLFGNRLPKCLLTVPRSKKFYGYFWGASWANSETVTTKTDEIALNPDVFRSRSLKDILSTLVHEQCHCQQHHFGKPTRNGYHNKEWVELMLAVGLVPSSTGEPGGKQTGQKVSHYIETGGKFDKACDELLAKGFRIPWVSVTASDEQEKTKKAKKASKTKYQCPSCDLNVWGKPGISVVCGECEEVLVAEASDEEE